MRRSFDPGMRYPCSAPESNHLLTVRGATLQILATSPVVSTSFILFAAAVVVVTLMSNASLAPSFAVARRDAHRGGTCVRREYLRPAPSARINPADTFNIVAPHP